MKTLVINRTQDTSRFIFQEGQLSQLGLEFEKIVATEKDTLSNETIDRFQNNWQRPLRVTEIACTMSHKQCWQRVIELNQPCLIIEDDALICQKIKTLLNELKTQGQFNIISLETRNRNKFISKTSSNLSKDYQLHSMLYDKGGAAGYILWPSAAQKLVNHLQTNGASPADALIGECRNLTRGQVNPAPILQLDMCSIYGIDTPSCSQSVIFTNNPRPKANSLIATIRFKLRRIKAQIAIFTKIHLLGRLCGQYQISFISILKKDFSPPNITKD